MENYKIYETAEQYLRGELSEEEQNIVDDRLETDKAFAEIFTRYLLARRVVKEEMRKSWKKELMLKLSASSGKEDRLVGRRVLLRMVAAVAAVLLLAIVGFWLWERPTPSTMFADTSRDIYQKEIFDLDTRAKDSFSELFENKDFKGALAEAEKQFTQAEEEMKWQWLERKGFCHWQLGEWDEAMSVFKELEVDEALLPNKNPGVWYQALTYLGKGDVEECKKLLRSISNSSEYEFRKDGIKLLEQL